MHAASPRKAQKKDVRHARFEALEAQAQAQAQGIVGEVRALQADRDAALAAPPPVAPRPAGVGTVVVGETPSSAGSPDLLKPRAAPAFVSASILAGKPTIASPTVASAPPCTG